MTVELRHVRAFVAIAEEGSITAAAARLRITQPALSRTLRALESHLGARLVDRSTHHLHLTPVGRTFHERAVAALAAVDDLLDPGQLGRWPIRLGHNWSALGRHTTTLVRRWQETYPAIPLEVIRRDDPTAGIAQGVTDLAVVRHTLDLPGLRTVHLLDEARVAAVAADGPLGARDHVTLADLADHPIAVNSLTGSTTLDLWPPQRRPPAAIEVASTDDWLTTVAAGPAIGVTTEATALMYSHPAIAYVPLDDAPPVAVHLTWRHPPAHPSVAHLIALTQEVVQEGRPPAQGASRP